MAAGIRTSELRKVYNTAPPLAAGSGGAFSFAAKRSKGKQPKPEIVALNGISLDIHSGEIFCLLGTEWGGQINNGRHPDHSRQTDRWPSVDRRTRRVEGTVHC